MKKYFYILIMAILGAATANAAVADLQNGYYRVANHVSQRYIQVMDNKGELMYSAGDADMRAIVLVKGLETVITDPATVLYLEKHGDKFDIQAQSTGIYQMISTYLNLMDSRSADGAYWAYGSKSGVTMYLYDAFTNVNRETSFLATKGDNKMRDWDIYPIDSATDNYFGVAPRVKSGNKYYEPFFADFPFTLTTGMKAYYITKVDEKNACVVYKEITGTVPRSTPVIIECTSDQPINNKLNIGGNASAISGNQAVGVYFEFELNKHENYVTYDKSQMRSLGVMSDGSLGAVTGDYKYVPRNTFYIPVSSSAPAQMRLVSEQEYANLADPVYPTGITLSSTSLSMQIGSTQTLTATVKPDDTTDKSVTWTSSNNSVVTVDSNGKLTAVAMGTATITAKCQNVTATCQVTVTGILPTSITLDMSQLDLKVGESHRLNCQVYPVNTTDKSTSWTTSNSAVATVHPNGTVTAVGAGQAIITVTCQSVSASCTVNVTAVEVTGITLDKSALDLNVGESYTLTATITPDNASDKTINWSSSNSAIATVDKNGKVTAVSAGTATITAKCGNKQATCQVTAKAVAATSITLSQTTLELNIGDSQTLTATVAPANATNKTVEWTSSAPSIASVDGNGKVTALAAGKATITAKCGTVSAACEVTSKKVEATAVTLNHTSYEMHVGQNVTLTASVSPANTTDKTVTWTSSNTAVATVDANGKVTAVALGTAEITATCGSAKATCKIDVTPILATEIRLNKTELTLTLGENETLTCQIIPSNATDKTTSWSSSNTDVATVASNGTVTAVGVGEAIITVTTGTVSATCKVTVTGIEATSITLSESRLTLTIGEESTLTATVSPADTTDPTVTWSSANAKVATVDANGKVTAVATGTAIITARCGSVSATCIVTVKPVEATAVTLDYESLEMLVGDVNTICATVQPANTTDPTIVWTSSDPTIASVSNAGVVTAITPGTAIITANCGNASASCLVTVKPIEADKVTLNMSTITMHVGDTEIIKATVLPANTTDKTVTWSTSDATVATVNSRGEVTAVAIGTAEITATCGTVSATCQVTVAPIEAEAITLDYNELSLLLGESKYITATVSPADTTDPTIVWTSGDTEIATVDDRGKVTAVGVGQTVITARCGVVEATCSVEVKPVEAGTVSLDRDNLQMQVGDEDTLIATVLPENVTDQHIDWTTSDAEVVSVDQEGHITALALGSATITATCGQVSAQCEITVVERPVETVLLDQEEIALLIGAEATLNATCLPENATYHEVTWESSDDAVVTVDADGHITAVAVGEARIKATAKSGAYAECIVTVLPIEAEELILNLTEATLNIEESVTLVAVVSPADTTYPTVTWISSDETVATVDAEGTVTAVAEGTATITAVCGNASASCIVTVNGNGGIGDITVDTLSHPADVYTVQGIKVRSNTTDLSGLPRGIYIVNGQKYYVK